MGEEPPTDQRPSRAQFTAIKALSYADLGLLGPNDLRTARTNRWTSTIVTNGTPTWKEIRGPSDPDAYTACWNILQTGWTMANAIWPPRMQKYHDMVRECCRRLPSTYALAYQQCDRYRKEIVPEIYRKEIKKHEHKIKLDVDPMAAEIESTLDPDAPWSDIYWCMVNAMEWQIWWDDNFKFYAEKIESGQIRLIDTIDGDAPIATNRNQHPKYAMVPPTSIAGAHREQHRPEGGQSKTQENKER